MIPTEARCLESHEWVILGPDTGAATIGLSDFAVEQLGDIVFLELPAECDKVQKGQSVGIIESDLFVFVTKTKTHIIVGRFRRRVWNKICIRG